MNTHGLTRILSLTAALLGNVGRSNAQGMPPQGPPQMAPAMRPLSADEKPLPRCVGEPQLTEEATTRVKFEIDFDARNGNLSVDGDESHPLPINTCFLPKFITTNQVVTIRAYSKFRTDVTVTPVTYTVQEAGLALNMPTQPSAAPSGPTMLFVLPPSAPPNPVYCILDETCDPAKFEKKVNSELTNIQNVALGFPAKSCEAGGHQCYRNQGEFERFVSDTLGLSTRWAAAMQAFDPTTIAATSAGYATLQTISGELNQISAILDQLRDESEQTNVSALNQPNTNQRIQVQFLVQENWTPLTFAPLPAGGVDKTASPDLAAALAAAPPKPQTPNNNNPAPTTPQAHLVRSILLEIHHLVRFNALGGFYWSTLPQRSFSVNPGPVYCTTGTGTVSTSSTSAPCVTSTATGTPSYPVGSVIQSQISHQLGFMLGMELYFMRRDLFPGGLTKTMRLTPGLLLGAAPSSPPSFMVGLNWEPATGIDFYAGGHVAQITDLAPGINAASYLPGSGGTVPTVTRYRCCGVFVGAGIDIHVFQSIFSSLLGAGGPGAAANATPGAAAAGPTTGGRGH